MATAHEIGWSKMTPQEVRLVLAKAPKVAGPWQDDHNHGYNHQTRNDPRYKVSWRDDPSGTRIIEVIQSAAGSFIVRLSVDHARHLGTGFPVIEEGKRYADEYLRTNGYLLDDESSMLEKQRTVVLSMDFKPDWSKYQLLAKLLKEGSVLYGEELRILLREARADAVRFAKSATAEGIQEAFERGIAAHDGR